MRRAILLLALLAGSSVLADEAPTIRFDINQLESTSGGLVMPGLTDVTISPGFTLPARSLLVELLPGENPDQIRASLSEEYLLNERLESLPRLDSTTHDRYFYDSLFANDSITTKFGESALEVTGTRRVNGRLYAELLAFAATYDSSGQLIFNPEIDLFVDSRRVENEALLSRDDLYQEASTPIARSPQAGVNSAGNYLIITSDSLAVTYQRLIDYRSQLGYSAELVTVEYILANWPGSDQPEQVREFLKQYYQDGGEYVLLGGDETVVPIRYAYHYNVTTPPEAYRFQICDLYYADLTGVWDSDGDGIYGERYDDDPDLTPELYVGRIPLNDAGRISAYIDKLIAYETNPGGGDSSYLTRAFFFSSDQMRDYDNGGQHGLIARAYPSNFIVDTVSGVEASTGDDPAPSNLPAENMNDILAEGFGIVNIIAHGSGSLFGVRSSGYNEWPKSSYQSEFVSDLPGNGKTAFYYSLACDNGGFDFDQPPFNNEAPNLVESMIGKADGGAVGFVAYSRWGWISSSYLLQTAFFDSLFAHPGRPAVAAMYDSKAAFYYYRDLVYGMNFFGDPLLTVYTSNPGSLVMEAITADETTVTVTASAQPVTDVRVVLTIEDNLSLVAFTDISGEATFDVPLQPEREYPLSAAKSGYSITMGSLTAGVVTGTEDDPFGLPLRFELHQNYPNPFNPETNISFDLPHRGDVRLTVYNLLGQEVITLVDQPLPPGTHTVTWNGSSSGGDPVATGVYYYVIQAEENHGRGKMVLLK